MRARGLVGAFQAKSAVVVGILLTREGGSKPQLCIRIFCIMGCFFEYRDEGLPQVLLNQNL